MKKFIAIIIALQIGLTPFCGVFAMETIQASVQSSGCEMMEEKSDSHISHQTPQLICCIENASSESSAQIQTSFDLIPPVLQACFFIQRDISCTRDTLSLHSNFKHPPDDFERLSQSKRE